MQRMRASRGSPTKVSVNYQFVSFQPTGFHNWMRNFSTTDGIWITSVPMEVVRICNELDQRRRQQPLYPILNPQHIFSKTRDHQGNVFCMARLSMGTDVSFLTCWYNLHSKTASRFTVLLDGPHSRFSRLALYHHDMRYQLRNTAPQMEALDNNGNKFLMADIDGPTFRMRCVAKLYTLTSSFTILDPNEETRLGMAGYNMGM